MDRLTAFVEIIKAVAWPLAISIAVFGFRRQLAQLLQRVTEVGPAGVKIAPPEQKAVEFSPESIERKALVAPPAADIELPPAGEPLNHFEQSIRDNLANRMPPARENLLVRGLAATQMELAFERINNAIFGSQIRLLRAVNSAGHLPADLAVRIYNDARAMYPAVHSNRSYEMWRDFLAHSGLIQVEAVSGGITPTPACPEFLAYMAKRHLPDDKVG